MEVAQAINPLKTKSGRDSEATALGCLHHRLITCLAAWERPKMFGKMGTAHPEC
ncbi:MAG: hypothetical protein SynsKO_24100 [Synoicihabitans sp.]